MYKAEWILLDTEVNGIKSPVYVVELGAQKMLGWRPQGAPFRRLVNQNAEISPEASRVNGYTREVLERDGEPPREVYAEFAKYVKDLPLVSYKLSYDLDDVLMPEWERLGIEAIGRPGFCALELTQRLLDPVPAGNHKLQTLRQYYRLPARGAHTALGDVETVADLMQQVLRPLAEQRGLRTWDDVCSFASATWFPSRIAFGKFKGRLFRDAREDPNLRDWLEWLTQSSNPRIAKMGRWYLEQIDIRVDSTSPHTLVGDDVVSDSLDVVIYMDPELEVLRKLISSARIRLADIEAEYTQDNHAVVVAQSQLFTLLRPHYQKRDELRLIVEYRRKYLDTLMFSGEEEAEETKPQYEDARAETEREYEEAAIEADESQPLNDEEQKELKTLWRKLVGLYHPDRFTHDPEKQKIYERLAKEINKARDCGDINRLREIANDPQGFLVREGLGSLDFGDKAEYASLLRHYENLQARILSMLDTLTALRESSDFELYRISREQPEFIQEIAEQQAEDINEEISELKVNAKQLAEEIEILTGNADPLGEDTATF